MSRVDLKLFNGHVVYCIGPIKSGPCKVGMTNRIMVRLEEIQGACWDDLFLHCFVQCSNRAEARSFEQWMHQTFSLHHRRGEWFNIAPADARKAISREARKSRLKFTGIHVPIAASEIRQSRPPNTNPQAAARKYIILAEKLRLEDKRNALLSQEN